MPTVPSPSKQYIHKKAEARTLCILASATLQKGRAGWHPSRLHPMSQGSGQVPIGWSGVWPIDRLYLLQVLLSHGHVDGLTWD